jgi:hypothetical protein
MRRRVFMGLVGGAVASALAPRRSAARAYPTRPATLVIAFLAADLVALNVAVIFIGGADIEMRALTAAVSKIPIVFAAAGDPVKIGIVVSLNRPQCHGYNRRQRGAGAKSTSTSA